MRRLLIAIALMLALILGCFWGYRALYTVASGVTQRVTVADTLAHDNRFADADIALEGAYSLWRNKQYILGALVRHDELDEIENLFLRALQSLQDRELSEYRRQSRELQGMLLHVPETQLPSIPNIF